MLIACWSPKGGSGTTVVSCVLAVALAGTSSSGAVLADLDGDGPAVLGIADPPGPGLAEWLRAGPDVDDEALGRLEIAGPSGVRLIPRGQGPLDASRADALADALAASGAPVVADCSAGSGDTGLAIATQATRSLLVVRPCYLALRRALAAGVSPSGVVLVTEPERALRRSDVEDILQVPVVATMSLRPSIARAVDAGLLGRRLPRDLARIARVAA